MALNVVIAGASGFLGGHLSDELRARGHSVVSLVRRPAHSAHESSWDPYAGIYDRDVVEWADVVVNLAGTPTIGNPHSRTWARNLRQSRVTTTQVLARAIADSERKPAFVAGNAIAWYGDHGDEVVTEASDSRGDSLLTEVTREWQDAAMPAAEAGARVCILRTSPVMHRSGPPLKQLRLLTRVGLGARLGDGLWSRRVRKVVEGFRPVFHWDRLYLGGGNSRRITPTTLERLGDDVVVVPNQAGIVGGVRAWELVERER